MPSTSLFRALSVAIGTDTAPDSELLRRFAEGHDRTAFELVVRRHAELVWGVCRATLPHDRHAAEDAFQAVFLALARRAASVHDGSAAGWLFRVARNAAGRASARSSRRRTEPLPDLLVADAAPVDELASARERAPVVIEEVDRLVAALREPVVLCFFEGCTHAEAAARLGWPVGTVASRLARAKDLLRARLVRRGVALSAAGPAVLMASGANAAPVRLALAVVGGPVGQIPPGVLSLTQGVLSAMRFAQLKTAVAVAVLAVGLAAAAVAAVPRHGPLATADRVALARPAASRVPQKEKPDPKELEAKEFKALKGEWRVVKVESGEETADDDELANMRATFFGNDSRITGAQGGDDHCKMALALAKTPRQIDLTIQGGDENPNAGKVKHGIYERTGDTLKLCIPETSFEPKDRPAEFKAKEGQLLLVLERIKDEKEERKALAGEWKCVKANVSGKDDGDKAAPTKWVIEGEDVMLSDENNKSFKATIKLDPAAVPPAIDLTVKEGEKKEAELTGIYFRQENKLTLCFADPKVKDAARPTELKPGDGRMFIVLERAPKK